MAEKVETLGGSVPARPPTDIPEVGRLVVINDPKGAVSSIITLVPQS